MPNLYMRQTALNNVGGRIDYISNPKRQEHLLGTFDGAGDLLEGRYWETLAKECQASFATHGQKTRQIRNRRTGEMEIRQLRAVEAREDVLALPNSVLNRLTPDQICSVVAKDFETRYNRPCMVALHQNKKENKLHVHIIFSERQLMKEPVTKVASRALFFDEQKRRHYKKSEILDDAGQLRPGCQIVPKGATYSTMAFGPADSAFSRRGWLRDAKTSWALPLINGQLRGDVEYQEYDPETGKLPQQHVGKNLDGTQQAAVAQYNAAVRAYNQAVDEHLIEVETAQRVRQTVQHAPLKMPFLQMIVEIIRIKMEPGYIPDWMDDHQGPPPKCFNLEPDARIQTMMDILDVARRYGVEDAQGLEDARKTIGQELAIARSAGDRHAEARARREYRTVKRKAELDAQISGASECHEQKTADRSFIQRER